MALPQITLNREPQTVSYKHDPAHIWVERELEAAPDFVPHIPAGADWFKFRPLSFREFAVIEQQFSGSRLFVTLETALLSCGLGSSVYEGADAAKAVQERLPFGIGCALARHILTVSGGDLEFRRFR